MSGTWHPAIRLCCTMQAQPGDSWRQRVCSDCLGFFECVVGAGVEGGSGRVPSPVLIAEGCSSHSRRRTTGLQSQFELPQAHSVR